MLRELGTGCCLSSLGVNDYWSAVCFGMLSDGGCQHWLVLAVVVVGVPATLRRRRTRRVPSIRPGCLAASAFFIIASLHITNLHKGLTAMGTYSLTRPTAGEGTNDAKEC